MRCVWCSLLGVCCSFWVFGECVFAVCVCVLTSFLGLRFCTAIDLLAEQYLSRAGAVPSSSPIPLAFVLTCSPFLNLMLPR